MNVSENLNKGTEETFCSDTSQPITNTRSRGSDPGLGCSSAVDRFSLVRVRVKAPSASKPNRKPTNIKHKEILQPPSFSGEVDHCPGLLRNCFGFYTMMKLLVLVEFRVPPGTGEDRQAGMETGAQCETATFPSSVP